MQRELSLSINRCEIVCAMWLSEVSIKLVIVGQRCLYFAFPVELPIATTSVDHAYYELYMISDLA